MTPQGEPASYKVSRPVSVEVREGMVWVTLEDGRTIGNPLEWHPWLANATPEALANIEMDAFSVYWPDLDEGLDIEGMLRGIHPQSPRTVSALP